MSLLEAIILKFFHLKMSISLTIPPASFTITMPAAMSQIFKLFWKYPSNRPDAT